MSKIEDLLEFMQTEAAQSAYTWLTHVATPEQDEASLIRGYKLMAPLTVLSNLRDEEHQDVHREFARLLLEKVEKPTIVDYGCGEARISMEVALMEPETMVYLLDVDCMTLDFTAFRFAKAGIRHEVIRVTEETVYPPLPPHNVCIAAEVFEHLRDPMQAYRNILTALDKDGILVGCFDDHRPGGFHVTPDLNDIRLQIEEDFVRLPDERAHRLFYRRRP